MIIYPHWKSLFEKPIFPFQALMVVPNEQCLRQLTEEICSQREVILGPKIYTFNVLEKLLSAQLGPATVNPWHKLFILNSLAPDIWDELGLPGQKDAARVMELAEQLGDGLDRLRLAGVEWETLEKLAPVAISARLAALGRRYERWLGKRDDDFGRRRKLIEALKAKKTFKVLEKIEVVYCQHSQRFSPFEVELLKAISVNVRVEVYLTAPQWLRREEIVGSYGYQSLRLVKELESGQDLGNLNLTWSEGPGENDKGISPCLLHASENLLGPVYDEKKYGPVPPFDQSLAIINAPTRYHEAEEVGRHLKALLVEGSPAHRLAVAVPTLEGWFEPLEDVGRRFGFNFNHRRGEPLRVQKPVEAILDLLDLWGSNWELNRVLKVLESPYFVFELQGLGRKKLIEAGVTDNRAEGGFINNLEKIFNNQRKELAGRVLEVIQWLINSGSTLASAKTWKTFRDRFQSILSSLSWPGLPPVNGPETEASRSLRQKIETETQAVELLSAAFRELFEAFQSSEAPPTSLSIFKLWLGKILSKYSVCALGPNPSGVNLLNYNDLHGCRFEALFLMGLNEKVFPAAKADGCWWPESLVENLAKTKLGRRLWSGAAENYQSQEEMVAQALAQAKKVTLSYHSSTEDLRPLLPSPLIESLKNLWPAQDLTAVRTGWLLPQPAERVCERGELWMRLAFEGVERKVPPEFISMSGFDKPEQTWDSIAKRRQGLIWELKKIPESFLSAWLSALPLYRGRPILNISQLTSRYQCPRIFLFQELWRLEIIGPPLEEWQAFDRGNLLHIVLNIFFRPLMEKKSSEFEKDRLKYIFWEQAHRQWCHRPVGRRPLWEIRVKELEKYLLEWLGRQRDIQKDLVDGKIMALEWSFGDLTSDSPEPFMVSSTAGDFYLKGRVDRLDLVISEEQAVPWLKVIDYKTTYSYMYKEGINWKPDQQAPRPGFHWPMILYGLAASHYFKLPARTFLEFIDARGGPGSVEIESGSGEELAQLWEGLINGQLSDIDPQNCPDCQYLKLCRGGENG
ncbi:MAG: PD-(D/E)XK nuclease family protein [Deltaproteobacteria bacterium]|jgi:ATP-dependent helicase/DNAse subunit B|nr:PD-(D/E)XK nuclease family protein [Deltaproteobacteria bacterium]